MQAGGGMRAAHCLGRFNRPRCMSHGPPRLSAAVCVVLVSPVSLACTPACPPPSARGAPRAGPGPAARRGDHLPHDRGTAAGVGEPCGQGAGRAGGPGHGPRRRPWPARCRARASARRLGRPRERSGRPRAGLNDAAAADGGRASPDAPAPHGPSSWRDDAGCPPRHAAAALHASRHAAAGHEAPRHASTRHASSRHGAPRHASSRHAATAVHAGDAFPPRCAAALHAAARPRRPTAPAVSTTHGKPHQTSTAVSHGITSAVFVWRRQDSSR